MKKIISFCVLLFIAFTLKAQSAEETLEWLRTKQPTIRSISADIPALKNGKLTIDDTGIKLSNEATSLTIPWNKVKDVTEHLREITIVSNELVDGKNAFIRFFIESDISGKYVKALKHMAGLKGAKLIKDDLF